MAWRDKLNLCKALGYLIFDERGEGLVTDALDHAWQEWTNRWGMAWNVLLGRPVAYKLHIRDGGLVLRDHSIVSHVFVERPIGPGITVPDLG